MIIQHFIKPGLSLLPSRMDTPEARVQLVAIGLQESRFQHRFQMGFKPENAPARGFWQFELGGGITGVLNHRTTRAHIWRVCKNLRIENVAGACYEAVAFNDALACVFARLLLWTIPRPLPEIGQVDEAWDYYIEGWRPGKPHRHTWDDLYAQAVEIVQRG